MIKIKDINKENSNHFNDDMKNYIKDDIKDSINENTEDNIYHLSRTTSRINMTSRATSREMHPRLYRMPGNIMDNNNMKENIE